MSSSKLPGYDDFDKGEEPSPTPEFKCLNWSLDGPISTSIQVYTDRIEPYQTTTTTNHPISTSAITEPKVSSITVKVDDLVDLEYHWCLAHDHPYGQTWSEVGDCPTGNRETDPEGIMLLRCCNTQRPKPLPPLVVTASTQPFVTVHDYVTAVHPWLLEQKADILASKRLYAPVKLPDDTMLDIDYYTNPGLIQVFILGIEDE